MFVYTGIVVVVVGVTVVVVMVVTDFKRQSFQLLKINKVSVASLQSSFVAYYILTHLVTSCSAGLVTLVIMELCLLPKKL